MRNAFLLIKNIPVGMPKSSGVPKSLVADVNKAKSRLSALEKAQTAILKTKIAALEKNNAALAKDLKDHVSRLNEALKKQQENVDSKLAELKKIKPAKKEKRKPSEYNLFLKDKMSQGMSMVDAVKAWKEREGGESSSVRESGQSWQSPTQQQY
jgi:hypothetical protein